MKQAKRRSNHHRGSRGQEQRTGGRWQGGLADSAVDTAISAAAHADCDLGSTRLDKEELLDSLVAGFGRSGGRHLVADRVTAVMTDDLLQLLRAGWGPDDLVRVVRRQAGATASSLALGPVIDAARRRGRPVRDDDDLADLAGGARTLDPSRPSWRSNLVAAVAVVGVIEHLPALPDLGSLGSPRRRARSDVEERVFARIRALLAKAESSDFPEEAEAFMAKAQQLMTHHCLDHTLLDEGPGAGPGSQVEGRRIWLEDPYLQAKSLLLAEVARANRCQAVVAPRLGFSTVVGFPADLDATELLFTSLLLQATRRLTALSHEPENSRRSRRPSYRRSFLVGYARGIGARLREATSVATAEADETLGKRLLPVLAEREDQVDAAVRDLFADLDTFDLSVSDYAGWAAGSAAADMADLAARDTLPHMAAS
jgi:hypothetical protein